jgi:hypothetical protein
MIILIFSLSILTSISLFASPLDLKSLKKDDLKKICSKVCGKDYASNAEIRDFYQLKIYPDSINQAGLLCSGPVKWQPEGTPCHKREAYLGIHYNGLAPTKTEIHRGSWSTERGGAWCMAYNEDDFKGIKKAIISGQIKPGQIVCMSGMALSSAKE